MFEHVEQEKAAALGQKFSISVDVKMALVRIKLAGFLTVDDVQDFAAAQRQAYQQLVNARGNHLTLCDVSECKIQPQEVVEAFRALLTNPNLMSKRMAFVTGPSPVRMQIRRLTLRDSCRFFDTAAEATHWLISDLAMSAAIPPTPETAHNHV